MGICPEKLSVTIPKNIKKNEKCAIAERYVPKVLWYMAVPGENQRPVASYWQTLSHNVVSSTLSHALKEPHGHKNNSRSNVQFFSYGKFYFRIFILKNLCHSIFFEKNFQI